MISTAIRTAATRNWASHHGFRAVAGDCDRPEAVKRYATRKAKAATAAAEEEESRSPPMVCADCGTSETPLWRSGPDGPKSLCNACGIKYRKRRRALAAPQGKITAQPTSSPSSGSKSKAEEEMRTEELKRMQREKQEKMLKLLLLQHQEQKRSKREEEKAAEEATREVEEAALLLLSLSSGLFAHS